MFIVTFLDLKLTKYRIFSVSEVYFSHFLQTRSGVDLIRFHYELALASSLPRQVSSVFF